MKQSLELMNSMTTDYNINKTNKRRPLESIHRLTRDNSSIDSSESFRRAFLFLAIMFGIISNAWGQTDLDKSNYNNSSSCAYEIDVSHTDGETLYGDGSVGEGNYADLSTFGKLMVLYEGATPRFLFNKSGESYIEITGPGDYASVQGNLITIDLAKMTREKSFSRLNAIKVNWGATTTLKSMKLESFREADESGCEEHVVYVKYDNDWNKTFSVDFAGLFKDKILECFGKSDISEFGPLYLRWYVADKTTNSYIRGIDGFPISQSGGLLTAVGGTHYNENVGMLWFHDGSNAFSSETDFSYAMNVNVDLSAVNFFQSTVDLVCLMTDDLTGISLQLEPTNLKHKFIVHFIKESDLSSLDFPLTSESPTKVYGKKVDGISDSDNAYNIQSVMTDLYSQAKNSGEALEGKTPKYARFYLTTASGIVKDASSVFAAGVGNDLGYYQDKGLKGLVWTGDSWPGDFLISNLTVNKSSSESWADLRIICDLTDNLSSSYKIGDQIIEEPTHLAARLIIGFNSSEATLTGFEGKLSKDAFTHTKEIIMTATDVANGYVVVPLNESFNTMLSEYNTTAEGLDNNLHLRWYVTCNGTVIAYSENALEPITAGKGHKSKSGKGIYWNSATSGLSSPWTGNPAFDSNAVKDILNVKFTKPDATKRWGDYKIVVVMTNDATDFNGQVVSGGELEQEPRTLNMKYTFTIYREDEFLFVHHKGASGRDYLTSDGDAAISTSSPSNQYSWNVETSDVETATRNDIRQGVHTVEYDLFVNTSGGAKVLNLPFESYTGGGNNLEPMAYIRWYDWSTDLGSDKLTKVGSWLEAKTDVTGNRGLFMLNNSWTAQHPTHSKIGVTYDPSSLTDAGDIIACDVSKYYDGIYKGVSPDSRSDFSALGYTQPILVHEPTLSSRYLYHIYPSSVIAAKINAASDTYLAAVDNLKNGTKKYSEVRTSIFDFYENNGRVIVSLNGTSGDFALRAQLQSIDNYFVVADNPCDKINWYAYLEDENGLWEPTGLWALTVKEQKGRVYNFDLPKLNGNYTLLNSSYGSAPVKKDVTAAAGMRFHVIGVVGDNASHIAGAIHYELQFVNAPAYLAEELLTKDVKRTDEYLSLHLDPAGVVNFDNYFPDLSKPTTEDENYRSEPLPWDEAQYGFCYPSIDKYRIATGYSGLTPIHGDYILLKSMKMPGISAGTGYSNMASNTPDAGYNHVYLWYNWDGIELDDYTHTITDNSKYGGFFYVDASDESRTIATLDFSANLCSGSQIYFTAAIADVTSGGSTSPQLMAHVYAKDPVTGEKVQVISFLTCVLNTVNNNDGGYKYNKWYQVYGYGTIPETIDITNYDDFTVEIDNYSKDTNGADFCVDQISFYTSTAQVQIMQDDVDCSEDKITMNIFMDGESLKNALGAADEKKTIYWSICDESGSPLEGAGIYNQGNSTAMEGNKYGKVQLTPNYKLNTDGTVTTESAAEGFYKGTDGNVYFKLVNGALPLEEGKRYYVSIYSMNNTPVDAPPTDIGWGAPTKGCTVCSDYFVAQKMHLAFTDFGGGITGTVEANCDGSAKDVTTGVELKRPDSSDPSGFKTYTGYGFDYFRGSKTDLIAATGIASIDVFTAALQAFRAWDYNTHSSTYTDYQTNASQLASDLATFKGTDLMNGTLIETVLDKLILSASATFKDQMSGTDAKVFNYMAFSISAKTSTADGDKAICSPLSFTFNYEPSASGPLIELGFSDVTYPDGEHRVVRLGLEQMTSLKSDYTLHVPIHSFLDKDRDKTKATQRGLKIKGSLVMYDSTDPVVKAAITSDGNKTAAVFTESAVSSTSSYISLNFHGTDVAAIDYHEGYAYDMMFEYREDADPDGACDPTCLLTLKIVPKYVTWNKTNATDGNNWNNDDNWTRSLVADLYKETTNTDSWKNNETIDASLSNSNTNYVPMKFSYVTLPTGNRAPALIDLTRGSDGLYNNIGTGATSNILYDILVKYDTDTSGSLISSCGHGASGNIYDCEKFYGNICKEIYFKPEAELINQQYLTYEKAWVEKELVPNTWYLMANPLRKTYAGDMYLPFSNGCQTTEAFQPITFNTTTYSRTKYPVYQHSWGSTFGSKVYVETGDPRASSYDGNITPGTVTPGDGFVDWGHTFNDVTVAYDGLSAFAIRAHRVDKGSATNNSNNALLRLPKQDETYDYYDWNGTSGSVPAAGTASVTTTKGNDYAQLLVDKSHNADAITLTLADLQSVDGYYLIGNPYMASLDMSQFLTGNTGLQDAYWTMAGGAGSTTGIIRPLEGFFVKNNSATAITINPSMMVDGNSYTPSGGARRHAMHAGLSTGIVNNCSFENIVVSVKEKTVTVRAASELKSVRVLDVSGALIEGRSDCGTETTLSLTNSGVYIVEVRTEVGLKTVKVIVK